MSSPPSANSASLKFLDFVNESPTPFHAVATASERLEKAGFERLSEKTTWSSLQAGKAYFYTRNQSALVAFVLPKGFESGVDGVGCVATHVDSCCLKVRPISRKEKGDYMQVAVETYGGGIWRSWFDRDLSLAGRVIVSTPSSPTKFESKLVNLRRPLLRIPSLAIHLDRDSAESFKFNKETQFTPILGLASAQLKAAGSAGGGAKSGGGGGEKKKERHWSGLIEVLAEELGVEAEEVKDFELSLYDTQPACLGGIQNEFLFAPRMDNLLSSFAAVEALAESYTSDSFASTTSTSAQAILLFDNEEVGSVSHHGAESSLLPELISRLTNAGINTSSSSSSSLSVPVANRVEEVFAKSFLISADMGHGIHPNFPEKHQELNQPTLGSGVVVKTNANQRYTSTAATTFLIRRVAEHAGVELQEFEVRNDMGCGSTVGPHLSTNLRCVDVGLAQLSMHSIRETAAASDVPTYIRFMRAFLEEFGRVDGELRVD